MVLRVGKIDRAKDATHLSVAANYNRRDDGDEWKTDPHWNRVTLFGKLRDRLARPIKAILFALPGVSGNPTTNSKARPVTAWT